MVGRDITSCSTQVANAREKAKDSRETTKRQTYTNKTGSARREDKNVDWPQIESRPFITLHLCTFLVLRSVPTPSSVRYYCEQKSASQSISSACLFVLSFLFISLFVTASVFTNRIRKTIESSFLERIIYSSTSSRTFVNIGFNGKSFSFFFFGRYNIVHL